ncbi:MAG: DegT/DnrJ/EryC1/StrS family aminotransferase, partial [Nanoarchaeota archaeon]
TKITKEKEKLINKEEGSWYQEMHYLGFNYRITDIQCALGISQLQRIDEFVEKRRKLVQKYREAFEHVPEIEVLEEPEGRFNPYHLFVIKLKNSEMRKKVFDHLKQNGILAQVHYLPVHRHPYYQNLGYAKGICPNAEEFYERIISLPLYYSLTNGEQEKVIRVVKEALNEKGLNMTDAMDINDKNIPDGVKKEINTFIFKYQKEDVNEKLGRILGEDFRKYRERFNKTQRYQETKFVPDFPLCLSLELVNRCNLNCVMCYKPHHSQPFAELSLETIQKIADECKKEGMPSLILGLGAETLIYPKAKEVLEIIRKSGVIDVFFGTNGVLLNDNIINAIFENQISRVEISLDAATPETYKKVRGYDLLPRIEANIEKLLEAKKVRNSQLPVIRLCFVVMDINKHETQQFIDKWKDKADYIDFQRCVDCSKIDQEAKIDSEAIKNSFCSQPFYSLNIWGNGNVTPCCSFYGEKLVIGNIHQQSLKEIWEGEKMKVIREQILTKRFNPTCQKCLYFRDNENIEKSFQQK